MAGRRATKLVRSRTRTHTQASASARTHPSERIHREAPGPSELPLPPRAVRFWASTSGGWRSHRRACCDQSAGSRVDRLGDRRFSRAASPRPGPSKLPLPIGGLVTPIGRGDALAGRRASGPRRRVGPHPVIFFPMHLFAPDLVDPELPLPPRLAIASAAPATTAKFLPSARCCRSGAAPASACYQVAARAQAYGTTAERWRKRERAWAPGK